MIWALPVGVLELVLSLCNIKSLLDTDQVKDIMNKIGDRRCLNSTIYHFPWMKCSFLTVSMGRIIGVRDCMKQLK